MKSIYTRPALCDTKRTKTSYFECERRKSETMTLLGDGSWELRVLVTDLQVERTLRVKGELHIGGVMIKLVDELGKPITIKRHIHFSKLD